MSPHTHTGLTLYTQHTRVWKHVCTSANAGSPSRLQAGWGTAARTVRLPHAYTHTQRPSVLYSVLFAAGCGSGMPEYKYLRTMPGKGPNW